MLTKGNKYTIIKKEINMNKNKVELINNQIQFDITYPNDDELKQISLEVISDNDEAYKELAK